MAITCECTTDFVDTENNTRLFTNGIFYTFKLQDKDRDTWYCTDDNGDVCAMSYPVLRQYFDTGDYNQ